MVNQQPPLSLQEMVDAIYSWANATFPDRTDASMYMKLYSEISELVEATDKGDELADLFIMLFDFAARHRIDVEAVVVAKLYKNMTRKWVKTSVGTYRHLKD